MDVALLYSLPTRRGKASGYAITDTDTEESAKKIYSALRKRVNVRLYPIDEFSIQTIKNIRCDVIVNLIEWDGNDLPLSLLAFDMLRITGLPVTGASKQNYLMTTDKLYMKQAFGKFNVPTPPWQAFYTGEEPVNRSLSYPVIVKLSKTHCSVGLTKDAVVTSAENLHDRVSERIRTFRQPVIAEEFIDGHEYQITLLERENGPVMLPPAEITFQGGTKKFLTFESRWISSNEEYKTSSVRIGRLNEKKLKTLEDICIRVFKKLRFHDYARFDIRIRGSGKIFQVYFLETNSNPGLDDDKDYGMTVSYKAAGFSFGDFLMEIIASAIRRKASIVRSKNLRIA